jgi:hypothetical protein
MYAKLGSELQSIRRDIERIKLRANDYSRAFARVPEPWEFGQSVLGAKLDRWQARYMIEARDRPRVAIAACRQSGKSTVTSLFVAWCLCFVPKFQCLIASRSLRQAAHFLNSVREAVLSIVPKDAMLQLNRLSMELPNGSKVISIPCAQPDAGRGFSPHLVVLDEAAFAPEALFRAITPSLAATSGALHMISSPNGRHGYFFDAFEGSAKSVFLSLRIPYTLCPRITEDTIRAERLSLGDLYFRQEYGAEFIVPEGAFFGHSGILNMDAGEDPDLSDLDLNGMETLLARIMPVPQPTVSDLSRALDRTQRVRDLLAD